jgi:hypothetical protein
VLVEKDCPMIDFRTFEDILDFAILQEKARSSSTPSCREAADPQVVCTTDAG